ncbi:restriction endonuclease subunit S [Psychromonas sp. KJ10-2]|uniref:restriction endonuclease subunit S n=1 Tax=Psychromonas sp. KJ10-2 TaxID=3391822 RepID=UPI0039B474AA
MGSDWKTVALADISERIGDGLHGTPKYTEDGGYYFVNGNNLESGTIVYKDSTKRVSFDEYQKHKKELGNSTVLVSINGTIGNVALYNGEEVVLGKSACYINLKAGISKEFIRYILSGYLFQEYIQRCSTGSTIKNVSLKMMRDFTFRIPESEKEQNKAVELLKILDQKLNLNQQTNQTLEKMAQTLFKSWFVDFDPVFDNALARADFNLENLPSAWPAALVQRATSRLQVLQNNPTLQAKLTQHHLAVTENNIALAEASQAENTHQHFPSEFELTDEPSIGINGWIPKKWLLKNVDEFCDVNPESWTKKMHLKLFDT